MKVDSAALPSAPNHHSGGYSDTGDTIPPRSRTGAVMGHAQRGARTEPIGWHGERAESSEPLRPYYGLRGAVGRPNTYM